MSYRYDEAITITVITFIECFPNARCFPNIISFNLHSCLMGYVVVFTASINEETAFQRRFKCPQLIRSINAEEPGFKTGLRLANSWVRNSNHYPILSKVLSLVRCVKQNL